MRNIKIRNNVFETNSSSMHSIVINTDKPLQNKYTAAEALDELKQFGAEVNDTNIILSSLDEDCLDYGWGVDIYNDFTHKMLYSIAEYGYDPDIYADLINTLEKYFNKTLTIPMEKLDYYSRDKSQLVYIQSLASIDHQSTGTLNMFLRQTEKTIMDFMQDPSIILIIDNDNH